MESEHYLTGPWDKRKKKRKKNSKESRRHGGRSNSRRSVGQKEAPRDSAFYAKHFVVALGFILAAAISIGYFVGYTYGEARGGQVNHSPSIKSDERTPSSLEKHPTPVERAPKQSVRGGRRVQQPQAETRPPPSNHLQVVYANPSPKKRIVVKGNPRKAFEQQRIPSRKQLRAKSVLPQPRLISTRDPKSSWASYTTNCSYASDCYCFHVQGWSMSKDQNPSGYRNCFNGNSGPNNMSCKRQSPDCGCVVGGGCLFTDMRPVKILAAITAARLSGVDHIIEEGRFGGLSAYMYSLHGFKVTSVEFLPLLHVEKALGRLAPEIALINGNGKEFIPGLVANMTDDLARKTMVIFDGEKRMEAYSTFLKIRARVGLCFFDDSNLGGPDFMRKLISNEIWWDTRDALYKRFVEMERPILAEMQQPLRMAKSNQRILGGLDRLDAFHACIVRGGGWKAVNFHSKETHDGAPPLAAPLAPPLANKSTNERGRKLVEKEDERAPPPTYFEYGGSPALLEVFKMSSGPQLAPRNKDEFAAMMHGYALQNTSLLAYLFPTDASSGSLDEFNLEENS